MTKKITEEERKRIRKKRVDIAIAVLFIIGIVMIIYPEVKDYVYMKEANAQIERFERDVKKLNRSEIKERLELARKYNRGLITDKNFKSKFEDPYRDSGEMDAFGNYAKMIEVDGMMGYVMIPSIGVKLPLYPGSSQAVLEKGVGHLPESTLPVGGRETHSILAAHRGNSGQELFVNLNKLKKGDTFYVRNIGGIIAYEVDDINKITPTDYSHLQVEYGRDYTTLLTCTPYLINTHRLIVRGHRVPFDGEVEKNEEEKGTLFKIIRISELVLVAAALLIIRRLLIK